MAAAEGGAAQPPRRRRTSRRARVVRTERLTPHLVRVVLGGPGLEGFALPGPTDAYVKLAYPPAGAPYAEPFDLDAVQAEHPRELWPVLRTYTVRAWDPAAGELVLDVVQHGDAGIAGPWAASARPGDEVQLLGPGGEHTPSPDAAWHLLAGDESALPAIAVTLAALPEGVPARVVVEVEDAREEIDLPTRADAVLTWVHRDGRTPGEALVGAVQRAVREVLEGDGAPSGPVHAFVHGEAGAVRELRRWLRAHLAVPRELLSASGYWRLGRTDEAWRAEKAEWKRAVEQDDAALALPG